MSLRILVSALLLPAVLATAVLGGATWAASTGCTPSCTDRTPADEDCSPDCDLCACCPSLRGVLAPPLRLPDATDGQRSAMREPAFGFPTPDPREILHVPITVS